METFNTIEIMEKDGLGKIKIDETELKGTHKYEIKRDTDIVTLNIIMSVPVQNFKTNSTP